MGGSAWTVAELIERCGSYRIIHSLQKAILHLHESDATCFKTAPVRELFNGQTIWQGPVEFFAVTGRPNAKQCFVLSHKAKPCDSEDRFLAVLEIPPVATAQDAVKVAIAYEVNETQKKLRCERNLTIHI